MNPTEVLVLFRQAMARRDGRRGQWASGAVQECGECNASVPLRSGLMFDYAHDPSCSLHPDNAS